MSKRVCLSCLKKDGWFRVDENIYVLMDTPSFNILIIKNRGYEKDSKVLLMCNTCYLGGRTNFDWPPSLN